jgi:peptidoglycan/LPS O-acetylase OafA/YrhL
MNPVCKQSLEGRRSIFDVIKAFAILMVVVTHFPWTPTERLHYAFPFWIDTAMPIFMTLSGYLGFCSFYNRKLETFGEVYELTYLYKRLARFVVPFLLLIPLDILCGMYGPNHASFANCLFRIILGGQRPGSYYVPMMIQFVIVFPIVYFAIRRYGVCGLMFFVLFNFLYECYCSVFGIHREVYSICLFRHLGIVAFGAFLAHWQMRTVKAYRKSTNMIIWGFASLLVGALYLYLSCYGYYSPIIFCRWKTTSLVAAFYTVGMFLCLMGWGAMYTRPRQCKCYPIEATFLKIGGRTYEIYLMQKIFYAFPAIFILNLPINRGMKLALCILSCLFLGVVYGGFINRFRLLSRNIALRRIRI